MPRLIWTPPALRDLERLHRFLPTKDRAAARRAVGAFRRGVSLLADHPQAGRPVEALPLEFRQWHAPFGEGGYVVLYR